MPASRYQLAAFDADHRRRQIGFGTTIAAFVLTEWFRIINPANIASTSAEWLEIVLRRIAELYRESALDALRYGDQIRTFQAPAGAPSLILPEPEFNEIKVRKSLRYMGPVNLALRRNEIGDLPLDPDPVLEDALRREVERSYQEAGRLAANEAAAAAVRHVRDGGRDATDLIVAQDEVALGWVRITAPGCCYFCAMLASRKAVYKEFSFEKSNADPRFQGNPGSGDYKVHDSCACSLRPVYTYDDEEVPEAALEFEKMWIAADLAAERLDIPTRIVFRQLYEGRLAA